MDRLIADLSQPEPEELGSDAEIDSQWTRDQSEEVVSGGPSLLKRRIVPELDHQKRYRGIKVDRNSALRSESSVSSSGEEVDEEVDEEEDLSCFLESAPLVSSEESRESEPRLKQLSINEVSVEDHDWSLGQHLETQLWLWSALIESRIQSQKALISCHSVTDNQKTSETIESLDRAVNALKAVDERVSRDVSSPMESGSSLEDRLESRFAALSESRERVLDTWHAKTRNAFKSSLEALEQSCSSQIRKILADRERLVRRSQISRQDDSEEADPERFDDSDFYHNLLRDLVRDKSGDHLMTVQRMRRKMKRSVDTRASKGRRVRYSVHPKLVSFMAPVDRTCFEAEARDTLFASLFR